MSERERRMKNAEIAELRTALYEARQEIKRLEETVRYWVHEYNDLDDEYYRYINGIEMEARHEGC